MIDFRFFEQLLNQKLAGEKMAW